jgi:hypothetical protein
MPVYANGGAGFTRSLGRSAIFCSMDLPRNLRHMTQPSCLSYSVVGYTVALVFLGNVMVSYQQVCHVVVLRDEYRVFNFVRRCCIF